MSLWCVGQENENAFVEQHEHRCHHHDLPVSYTATTRVTSSSEPVAVAVAVATDVCADRHSRCDNWSSVLRMGSMAEVLLFRAACSIS